MSTTPSPPFCEEGEGQEQPSHINDALYDDTVTDVREELSGQIQVPLSCVLVPLPFLGFQLVPKGTVFELNSLLLVPHQGAYNPGNITMPYYFRRLQASWQEVYALGECMQCGHLSFTDCTIAEEKDKPQHALERLLLSSATWVWK